MKNVFGKPDWVLLGMRLNGQCAVIASTHLQMAELEQIRDDFAELYSPPSERFFRGEI